MTDFRERVFAAVRAIPAGEVRTYGEIAEAVGSAGGAIAVGQALMPLELDADHGIPFWRVVLANGAVNTAEAEARWPDEVARVRRALVEEGVEFTDDGRVASVEGRAASASGGGALRSSASRQRAPQPCWQHDKVQYSCRECVPVAR